MFDYIIKLFTQPSYQHSLIDTFVLFGIVLLGLIVLYAVGYILYLTYRTIRVWINGLIHKRKLKKLEKQDKGE